MRASRRNARDEIRKRSRASKDEQRQGREGIGEPENGVRLPASGYADEPPAGFPGVAEPELEPAQRGASPPATALPGRPDDA